MHQDLHNYIHQDLFIYTKIIYIYQDFLNVYIKIYLCILRFIYLYQDLFIYIKFHISVLRLVYIKINIHRDCDRLT